MGEHLTTVTGPATTGCKYQEYHEVVQTDGYQFNVLSVKCPVFPNRAVEFSYTDTADNWGKTVEHCANIMINEAINGEMITRTYVVNTDTQ